MSNLAVAHDLTEEQRIALRKPVRLRAQLRDRSHSRFEIDILDLSMTGFRLHTIFNLPTNTIVWVTLPNLAGLEASVAWRDRQTNFYGCRFANPLHAAVFDHIVALAGA
jgi:hypothetical protein